MRAGWHEWRWMWECIGLAFMRDAVKASRVSYWWLGYLDVASRWANTLLGPERWTPPEPGPPVDAWAYERAARSLTAGVA